MNPEHKKDGTFAEKGTGVVSGSDKEKEDLTTTGDESPDVIDDFDLSGIDLDDIDMDFFDLSDETLDDVDMDFFDEDSEKTELIDSLDMGELEKSIINIIPGVDEESVINATEDELKALLKAYTSLSKLEEKLKNDEILNKLKENKFIGLWEEAKTPEDYEKLINTTGADGVSSRFDSKKIYFEYTYKGEDKAEKIAQLAELEKLGKEYIERKKELLKDSDKYQDLVDKFTGAANPFSQIRKDKAVWCTTDSEVWKNFKNPGIEYAKKLKKENPEAYKSAEFYTGSYSCINEPLRKEKYGKWGDPAPYGSLKTCEKITEAIDGSTFDFDFWMERRVSNLTLGDGRNILELSKDELNNLVGQKFEHPSFYSGSVKKAMSVFDHYPVVINTYCPKNITKGLYVESFSDYPGEREMILQRGYSFKITKVEKDYGRIYLDVELVPGSDENKPVGKDLKDIYDKYGA